MEAKNGHLIEGADGVSVASLDGDVDGAGVASKATTLSREAAAAHGLSPRLLDELAELAEVKVRDGGLKLMGGGLLVELTRHLMQAAVEAEMDQHLGEEAARTGGRGSRSGGNARNGYRPRKVMTEVGAVAVQVPRDRAGHVRLQPAAEVRAADRRLGRDGPLRSVIWGSPKAERVVSSSLHRKLRVCTLSSSLGRVVNLG